MILHGEVVLVISVEHVFLRALHIVVGVGVGFGGVVRLRLGVGLLYLAQEVVQQIADDVHVLGLLGRRAEDAAGQQAQRDDQRRHPLEFQHIAIPPYVISLRVDFYFIRRGAQNQPTP